MLRNCDCGACCEECGHYDDCIRNAGRPRDVAAEVAMEDGSQASRGARAIKHPSYAKIRRHLAENPMPQQQDRRSA